MTSQATNFMAFRLELECNISLSLLIALYFLIIPISSVLLSWECNHYIASGMHLLYFLVYLVVILLFAHTCHIAFMYLLVALLMYLHCFAYSLIALSHVLIQPFHDRSDTRSTFGLVGRVIVNGPGNLGSIPGRVIPKTLKRILDTSLLNTH